MCSFAGRRGTGTIRCAKYPSIATPASAYYPVPKAFHLYVRQFIIWWKERPAALKAEQAHVGCVQRGRRPVGTFELFSEAALPLWHGNKKGWRGGQPELQVESISEREKQPLGAV